MGSSDQRLAGISALLTWPFLVALQWSPNQWLPGPFYVVILWGLIMSVWLLLSLAGQTRPGNNPMSELATWCSVYGADNR